MCLRELIWVVIAIAGDPWDIVSRERRRPERISGAHPQAIQLDLDLVGRDEIRFGVGLADTFRWGDVTSRALLSYDGRHCQGVERQGSVDDFSLFPQGL